MTEQETRRSDEEEIIERIREIQPQSSPLTEGYFGGFAEAKSRILEILYTAPELKKQANLKLLDDIEKQIIWCISSDQERWQVMDRIKAKRRELEK